MLSWPLDCPVVGALKFEGTSDTSAQRCVSSDVIDVRRH